MRDAHAFHLCRAGSFDCRCHDGSMTADDRIDEAIERACRALIDGSSVGSHMGRMLDSVRDDTVGTWTETDAEWGVVSGVDDVAVLRGCTVDEKRIALLYYGGVYHRGYTTDERGQRTPRRMTLKWCATQLGVSLRKAQYIHSALRHRVRKALGL